MVFQFVSLPFCRYLKTMGLSLSKVQSEAIGDCSIPAYSIKSIGSRHFLVAGGGGPIKTGVRNEIKLFLLTYNQSFTEFNNNNTLRAKQIGIIDTTIYANMNMDCLAIDTPQSAKYLVVVGQDKYCALYESTGFCVNEENAESKSACLSLNFTGVCRFQTDWHSNDPYQKCVKIFRNENNPESPILIATGGADGHVRVWNASNLLVAHSQAEKYNFCEFNEEQYKLKDAKSTKHQLEIVVKEGGVGEVDHLDVSASGDIIATISGRKACFWESQNGDKLLCVPDAPQLHNARIRVLRFLNLDKSRCNEIFVCAYNHRQGSNESSFLALWAYEKKRINCHLILAKQACSESVACLAVQGDGDFIAIGTMAGSVAIFNTHSLQRVYFSVKCHSSFVTSLEFLPQRTYDSDEWGRISSNDSNSVQKRGQCFLPGVCSGDGCAVALSLSVDNYIKIHRVPYPPKSSLSGTMLRIALSTSFLYIIFWFLFLF